MRISFDALRLCLLVAAGITSGYLWRAAFESTSPAEERIAATPSIVEQTPAPPVVRIAPHHLTTTKQSAVVRQAVGRPVTRAHPAPTTLISSNVAAPSAGPTSQPPESSPTSSTPAPSPAPKPSPGPAPAPPPSAPTATTPVAAPVEPVVTPPPPATTTAAPPPTNGSGDESRPGWGKGDDNHEHSGPGGDGKGKHGG